MKKMIIVTAASLLCLVCAKPLFASPEYVNKIARGVANMACAPLEVWKQTDAEVNSTQYKAIGFLGGILKGLGYTLARFASGAFDVLTFPFKLTEAYSPILKPAYVDEGWVGDKAGQAKSGKTAAENPKPAGQK